MEHTSNYWKTVFRDLKHESKTHPNFVCILLALLTIPMGYAVNGFAVALLVLVSLVTFKKAHFRIETSQLLPLSLFVLMALSLLWTNDLNSSVKALQKGLPLILIPICFLISPPFTIAQKRKLMGFFSIGMVAFTLYWLGKAAIRFAMGRDLSVFFYHELVTEDVNAIHVAVYVTVAISYFMTVQSKTLLQKLALLLLSFFLILLSSKNITVIFVLISVVYGLRHFKSKQRSSVLLGVLVLGLLAGIAMTGKIKDRFTAEFQQGHSVNKEMSNERGNVYNVSIAQAWNQEKFNGNDYFPGTAFRVYQLHIFTEMLREDNILFSGYGLNASAFRIEQKGREHGVYDGEGREEGYLKKNFHNQYIQLFAELGIFGFLILMAMVAVNLKNAIRTKDFIHISFAILMISLFLTESFLSRQRGIVFFTIMYCLYNATPTVMAPKQE